jgi:hypothetical protein
VGDLTVDDEGSILESTILMPNPSSLGELMPELILYFWTGLVMLAFILLPLPTSVFLLSL